MRPSPALLPLFFACGAVACESIIGANFDDPARRSDTSAKRDASVLPTEAGTDAGAEPPCSHLPPPPLHAGVDTLDDTIEFTVVMSEVDWGDYAPDGGAPAYLERGFDLDGVCTSPGRSSCRPQPWIGSVAPDGTRGQDDAVGRLMLAQYADFGVRAVGTLVGNAAVERGEDAPTAILRIRKFSGLSSDENVVAEWFVAAPPATGADAGGPPKFDGTDHFTVLSNTVANSGAATAADTESLYRDTSAYVDRNRLVAHFDHVLLPLRNVYFDAYDVYVTGEPIRDLRTNTWTLENGTFSARGHTDDFLKVIPQIAKHIFNARLCTTDLLNYPPVKRFICESADLAAAGGSESSPCTESSTAATFKTRPGLLGGLVAPPIPEQVCPPGASPADDTCATPPAGD